MMSQQNARVLVVDDEPNILKTMEICLKDMKLDLDTFTNPREALSAIGKNHYDLAFIDLKMQPINGLELLESLKKQSPATTVVIVTAHGSIETAVDAIRKGAYDYLQKPFDFLELQLLAQKVLEYHRLKGELTALRQQLSDFQLQQRIITQNKKMLDLIDLARRVADSDLSVLIEGESGTGKELFAQLIHDQSSRSGRPFIKVNCAAIPENLLESELFGHVKGAFTGAIKDRLGRFELANGGTIFLDEIGELSPVLQAKLLRVLQFKEIERVGEAKPRKIDVRIVAATNKNLDEALKEGIFREDLFYRLNAVRLRIPPLRERPDDIRLLIKYFLTKFSSDAEITISPEAMKALQAYRWNGNVRELENVMERAVLLARDNKIELDALPEEIQRAQTHPLQTLTLEEVEKSHIKQVLQMAADLKQAAEILGIDQATLWRKRKRYGF